MADVHDERGVAVERMFSAIAARYDFLRGLREMHRVLKAGGRAVILGFTTPPGRAFRRLYLWYFHWILPRIGRLVSGHPSAYSYLPASVAGFPPPDGLTRWTGEAGFSNVSYRLLTGGIVAIPWVGNNGRWRFNVQGSTLNVAC